MDAQNLKLPLVKMHGASNDFLICDLRDPALHAKWNAIVPQIKRFEWVKKVCDRNKGVGADGFVFLEPHLQYDFAWDFYNSDGSTAEMCGNAARCAALCVLQNSTTLKSLEFLTLAGPIKAFLSWPGTVTVETSIIQREPAMRAISFSGKETHFRLFNTGVPHCVLERSATDELRNEENKNLARRLRSHSSLGPKGSNVTFFQQIQVGHIRSVTFERGVEDFTMACGTGVLAAGFEYCQNQQRSSCQVSVPGGELSVDFCESRPRLTGPAEFVAHIELCKEFLKA